MQWNIGGGKVRRPGDDPADESAYCHEGIQEIVECIQKHHPDIVTLQEVHADATRSQAEVLAKACGFSSVVWHAYADSHLEEGQKLCQAILSHFPLSAASYHPFYNPKIEVVRPNGKRWVMHDKGATSATADLDGQSLNIKTCHSAPLWRFGVLLGSKEHKKIARSMEEELALTEPRAVLGGDFNFNDQSLQGYLPALLSNGTDEVHQELPTNPEGKRYDHILYRGLRLVSTTVDDAAMTDHFPVLATFETV